VLLGFNTKQMGPNRIAFDGTIGLAVAGYAGVGRLTVSRVPRNTIG
jgi:hypothetical protein